MYNVHVYLAPFQAQGVNLKNGPFSLHPADYKSFYAVEPTLRPLLEVKTTPEI